VLEAPDEAVADEDGEHRCGAADEGEEQTDEHRASR
jgi:hypothetical protein